MYRFEVGEASSLKVFPQDTIKSPELFLKRLRRLLVLRYQAAHYLDDDDVRLLDRCVYATFCECIELNAGAKARDLLDEARATQVRSRTR